MKGLTLKTTITLVLTLLLLGAYVLTVLNTTNEAVKRSLFVQTEQIVGVINILQSSPSGSSHQYILRRGECELKINSLSVSFTKSKNTIVKEIVNAIPVEEKSIKCSDEIDKTLYFKRCRDKILADEKSGECG